MIRNIFIFLFFGFALSFIALWLINGGISRTQTIIQTSPNPLANLLGLSSSSTSFFTLPGQSALIPQVPVANFDSTTDTSSTNSGTLTPAESQARLDQLKVQYQQLRSEYETSGAGYTHPQ